MNNKSNFILWRQYTAAGSGKKDSPGGAQRADGAHPSVDTFIAQMKAAGHDLGQPKSNGSGEMPVQKKAARHNPEPLQIICSGEGLEQMKANTCLTGKIFVLVELFWYGYGDFQGLQVARDLMSHFGKDCPLNIHFVSFLTRRMILDKTEGDLFTIARQFQLILLPVEKGQPHLRHYLKPLYELLWNNTFQLPFRFNILEHSLSKLTPRSLPKEFAYNFDLLQKYRNDYKSADLRDCIAAMTFDEHKFNPVTAYKQFQKIRGLLARELADLGELPGFADNKERYKVAIVDDNSQDIANLKHCLEKYFEVPDDWVFCNGQAAEAKLAGYERSGIKAVFLDQELLDEDGGYQAIQGLDLFDLLQEAKYKGLQARLVTSMTKEAITMMYPNVLSLVLFKKNGNYSVSVNNLHKFFLKLREDIINTEGREMPTGPSIGYFKPKYGLKQLYYSDSHQNEVKEQIRQAKELTTQFLNGKLKPGTFDPTLMKYNTWSKTKLTEDEKITFLGKLLKLRLLLLSCYRISDEVKVETLNDCIITKGILFLHYNRRSSDLALDMSFTDSLNNNPVFKKKLFRGAKLDARYYINLFPRLGFEGIDQGIDENNHNGRVASYLFGPGLEIGDHLLEHEIEFLKSL